VGVAGCAERRGCPRRWGQQNFPLPTVYVLQYFYKKNCCERRVVEAEHATRPLPGMEVVSCDGLWKLNTQQIRYR
jgi:hypothetical protein